MPAILRIAFKDNTLHARITTNQRFTRTGPWTFLRNVRPGEVDITVSASAFLENCPPRISLTAFRCVKDRGLVIGYNEGASVVAVPAEMCHMDPGTFTMLKVLAAVVHDSKIVVR